MGERRIAFSQTLRNTKRFVTSHGLRIWLPIRPTTIVFALLEPHYRSAITISDEQRILGKSNLLRTPAA